MPQEPLLWSSQGNQEIGHIHGKRQQVIQFADAGRVCDFVECASLVTKVLQRNQKKQGCL